MRCERRWLVAGGVLLLFAACASRDTATTATTTPDLTSSTGPPATLPSFPPQPADVPWPTDEWSVRPWPAAADRDRVDAATDAAFAGGGVARVRAVVIVHDGAIVYERYSPNPADGPDVVMPSYSIAKSVTSAAVGVLVRDGQLDIDEPAPVPEWHGDPDDPRAGITVEDMLHMATGMPWEDDFNRPGTDMYELVRRDDAAAYAAAQELTWEPGEHFEYNTGTSVLVARIVGEAVGTSPEATRAFLDAELFGVIGMAPVETKFDERGTWLGGYSADSTARGFAKLGLLYLRGGTWDGLEVLSEAWIERTRTPSEANPDYGLHWWIDAERPGVIYAIGARGQVITVDPAHDLVVVQLSTVGGELPLAHTEAILEAFAGVEP